jgi:uncharacterized delta-60 repeat protein
LLAHLVIALFIPGQSAGCYVCRDSRAFATPGKGGNKAMNRLLLAPIPNFQLEPLEPRRTFSASSLASAIKLDVSVDGLDFDSQPALIQSDGKIIISAIRWRDSDSPCSEESYGTEIDALFIRLNPDGSRDLSYGQNGTASITCMDDIPGNLLLQRDGKLILISDYDGVVRLTRDGQIDPTFHTPTTLTPPHAYFDDDDFNWIAPLPDGRIIVGGQAWNDRGDSILGIIRLNPDGSFDKTYGVNGAIPRSASDQLGAASFFAVQSDGKLLADGWDHRNYDSFRSSYPDSLLRFNSDGTPDSSFGENGRVQLPGQELEGRIIQQPDGKILQLLYSVAIDPSPAVGILRFNIDGSLDSSFAVEGQVMTSWGEGIGFPCFDMLVQPDGKIIIWDHTGNFIRLNPDGSIDPTFGIDGAMKFIAIIPGHELSISGAEFRDGKLIITIAEWYSDSEFGQTFVAIHLITLSIDGPQSGQIVPGDPSIAIAPSDFLSKLAPPAPDLAGAAQSLPGPTNSENDSIIDDIDNPLDWEDQVGEVW